MAEEIIKATPADISAERQRIMTEEQREAYDEFIDYMAELYRRHAYLFDEDDAQQGKESVG